MTRDITIKDPSKAVIRIFDSLKEKKEQQIKRLSQKPQCTFTITV